MTNRRLAVLAALAAILLAVTAFLYRGRPKATVGRRAGTRLIQGLAPENVWSIEVARGNVKTTLVRDGDRFAIEERSGYPADTQKVNELLVNSLEIRIKEKIGDSASSHEALGVALDSPEARTVTLKDKDGETLLGYVAGKDIGYNRGMYVRLLDEDETFAAEESIRVHVRATDYMNKDVAEVKKDDVERVTVRRGDMTYVSRRDEKGDITLENIPEGKQPIKTGVLFEHELVFDALDRLEIVDVTSADEAGDFAWDKEHTAELKSGLKYVIRFAEKDAKHYAVFSAQPPPPDRVNEARRMIRGRKESDAKLKEREAVILAAEEAIAFKKRHEGWVYEVSLYRADAMTKPFAKLIEDIPAPEVEPEEIAASHILIAWAGAERSKATRTKEEANALAVQVLMKARKRGADFAKLAEENSDDPVSKTEGGDLGTFKRGVMDKAFEDAAFKLKVGELSGIVETPFGWHIIKRTK